MRSCAHRRKGLGHLELETYLRGAMLGWTDQVLLSTALWLALQAGMTSSSPRRVSL